MIDLALAFLLLIGAAGGGKLIVDRLGIRLVRPSEQIGLSLAAGFGCLIVSVILLGMFHLLHRWSVTGVVFLWVVLGSRGCLALFHELHQRAGEIEIDYRSIYPWLLVFLVLVLGLNLIKALAPPHGATDPLAYQLALPKIFLQQHKFSFEPTITGALYPINMGVLFIIGLALNGNVLPQVLHWLMGALSCVILFGFCQRFFTWRVGIWSAVLFAFVPIVTVFGSQGYVDVGLCFFQLAAFWALAIWLQERETRILLLAGVLAGLAAGVKHQGLVTLVLGGGVVAVGSFASHRWNARVLRDLFLFSAVAAILLSPWYLRSMYYAGNPVWPLANGFFAGEPFGQHSVLSSRFDEDRGLGAILVPSLAWLKNYWRSLSPWEWTFSFQGWQKAIGVYFVALLPGLLVFARSKGMYFLTGFCVAYYALLIRVLHMNPRYGLALLAILCILCGYVADRLVSSRLLVVRWSFQCGIFLSLCMNTVWPIYFALPVMSVVMGSEPRDHFLQTREGNYRMFQFVKQSLPIEAKLLLQGIVRGFYCDRAYIWDHPYQRLLNYGEFEKPSELLARMRELGISHVARMIRIPPGRTLLGYPQYFADNFHESFRKSYLRPIYRDESYVLFEVVYPNGT